MNVPGNVPMFLEGTILVRETLEQLPGSLYFSDSDDAESEIAILGPNGQLTGAIELIYEHPTLDGLAGYMVVDWETMLDFPGSVEGERNISYIMTPWSVKLAIAAEREPYPESLETSVVSFHSRPISIPELGYNTFFGSFYDVSDQMGEVELEFDENGVGARIILRLGVALSAIVQLEWRDVAYGEGVYASGSLRILEGDAAAVLEGLDFVRMELYGSNMWVTLGSRSVLEGGEGLVNMTASSSGRMVSGLALSALNCCQLEDRERPKVSPLYLCRCLYENLEAFRDTR